MNNNGEFRKSPSRWANQRINDGHVLRLAYEDGKTYASSVPYTENYRSCIYL